MTPYYQDDAVAIYQSDALDMLRSLPDSSVDLIATDPPFYRVKDEPWDRAWDAPEAFLAWIGELCEQWQRVLAPNGSLYVFASVEMAARVEVEIRRRFNVLNSIRWAKERSRAEGSEKEALRCYFPASEAIVFAEHFGADNMAKGEAGYVAKCDELRGFVFEPLRAYLDGERVRAGVSVDDCNRAIGNERTTVAGHYFHRAQWMPPTSENYAKLRALFNRDGDEYLRKEYEELRKEYEELRKEYEELRKEYEELRRPFALTPQDAYTDVWTFPTVGSYHGKHPCEKPPEMARHIVKASSREGGTVLDCFCGSGVFLAEAVAMGRKAIGCDALDRWVETSKQRCTKAARGEAWTMGGKSGGVEALPGQRDLF